ncbi:MAG: HD domain-containing protein [Candidatus Uhrbacteria bacterium]
MCDSIEQRLQQLGERIDAEPGFAFLNDLATVFPDSEAFVVGGIVRDAALARDAKDYDFIVRGVPADQLAAFLQERGKVNLVGRTFGVYKFVPQGWPDDAEAIDIALPRTEHAEGTGGYRDVETQSDPMLSIADDLARRDFTINAMAWDIRNSTLIDPFNGRADLDAHIIRAVGSATERFTEDRSRMLRALRFACQLGFTIDEATLDAIRALMPQINEQREAKKAHPETTLIATTEFITPREVIARELIKSFVANPVLALDLWRDAGAIDQLMPELLPMEGCAQPEQFHAEGDVWQHTRLALERLSSDEYREWFGDTKPSALTIFGILFHDIGKPPTQRTPDEHDTDRIRFDGHDTIGAKLTREIAQRLRLDSPFETEHPNHIDVQDLAWLVKNHLLLVNDPSVMRPATIERHFLHPDHPGYALQQIAFCDGAATVSEQHPDGTLDHFRTAMARIAEVRALVDERNRLPAPVLDGNEIMDHFTLKGGPHMSGFIRALREEQLRLLTDNQHVMTKEEARIFLQPLVDSARP